MSHLRERDAQRVGGVRRPEPVRALLVSSVLIALVAGVAPQQADATAGASPGASSRQGVVPARVSTRFVTVYDAVLQGGGIASNGAGLARRVGGPSEGVIELSGVPRGAAVVRAFLYWVTIGAVDARARLNNRSVDGRRVGITNDTCWGIGPNRVYRANVTGLVRGNGSYRVSGVANTGVGDGQGAALVVVFGKLGAGNAARVIVNNGALSVRDFGASMTETFSGLSGKVPQSAELHLGVADGQSSREDPVRVGDVRVTGRNLFSGSDGPLWDDFTIPLPTDVFLARRALGTRISLPAGGTASVDCLAWAYAGLVESSPLRSPRTHYRGLSRSG